MNPAIIFEVEGEPKGQPRPRAFARGGMVRVYNPGTAEGWKSQIAAAAKDHRPAQPLDGPITLSLVFRLQRPMAHFRTGKHRGELRDNAPRFHTGKPDVDNFAKAVMDALTTLGFWKDDAQVAELRVIKLYSRPGYKTGCEISIHAPYMIHAQTNPPATESRQTKI